MSPTETISITRSVPSNDFGKDGFAHVTLHGFHLHGSEKARAVHFALPFHSQLHAYSGWKLPASCSLSRKVEKLFRNLTRLSPQFEVWMQALAPGAETQIHRHMSEESITILEVKDAWRLNHCSFG